MLHSATQSHNSENAVCSVLQVQDDSFIHREIKTQKVSDFKRHIIFYSYFLLHFLPYLYLCIFSCFCIPYKCTVHGADLTYISLLIIFCITVYVTNENHEYLES